MFERIRKLYNTRKYFNTLVMYAHGHFISIFKLIVFDTISTSSGILLAILSKNLIDNAIEHDTRLFLLYLSLFTSISIIALFLRSYTKYLRQLFSEQLNNEIQLKVMNNYFTMKWSEVNNYQTGDVITRITKDVSSIVQLYTLTIPTIISLSLQFILALIIVLQYDVLLGLYGFTIAPFITLISIHFSRKIKPLQDQINTTEGRYRSYLSEVIQNAIIVKTFQNEEGVVNNVKGIQKDKISLILKKNRTIIGVNFMISSGYTISSTIALGFGAFRISQGIISFGTFTAILQLLSRMQTPIMTMARLVPQYISTIAAVDRCEPFNRQNIFSYEEKTTVSYSLGININDLSFNYKDKQPIFSNLNLHIKPGEKIAVIGTSGIGKTTLIRLIMNLLEPEKGTIIPFSEDHYFINKSSYYTYVPQGNTLFSGTIRRNLQLGKPNATDDELFYVLEKACAVDFIASLPKGLDSHLGEQGLGLSEGQLQRICIARALLRDVPILLLDEATSALDQNAEEDVIHNIYQNYPNKTVIAITHRPSILSYVDKIIEITCNNEIIERTS